MVVPEAHFAIVIDFDKESPHPERIFQTMVSLIEAFRETDTDLIGAIDSRIEAVLTLEDIEAGSLKTWFRQVLHVVDDDALKNIDWKPAVGKYLVRAKYWMIYWLDGRTEITDREDIETLEAQILEEATASDVRRFPAYAPVPPTKLLARAKQIQDALSGLSENDKARFEAGDDIKASFNIGFEFAPESIAELITSETIETKQTMILKVKRPDYLGQARWEFRHEERSFFAKVEDAGWVQRFQSRQIDVRPGDSIKAEVLVRVAYGFDGEVVHIDRCILEVIDVLRPPTVTQQALPLPPDKD